MNSTFDDFPHPPATILVPSGRVDGSKNEIPCSFSVMEGKRMILESPERVSMSTPISVEYNDAMFLGEVVLCRPTDSGIYRVEVLVEQILTGLQSLIALRAGLLGASGAVVSPQEKAHAFVPVATQNRSFRN